MGTLSIAMTPMFPGMTGWKMPAAPRSAKVLSPLPVVEAPVAAAKEVKTPRRAKKDSEANIVSLRERDLPVIRDRRGVLTDVPLEASAASDSHGTLSQLAEGQSLQRTPEESRNLEPWNAAAPSAPVMDAAKAQELEALHRLVYACLRGDSSAWQQLVVAQHRRVYGICYRFTGSPTDAEDLTQDVFLKVYKNLPGFDPEKGAFTTWLTTLTRNMLVDHFRRTRLDRATDSLDENLHDEDGPTMAERLADTRPNQMEQVARQEMRVRIQHALKQLSPELREAVILRDLQDMDYREIAAVLRVPEGTVKSRISRGRAELARMLGRTERKVM
ncbi:RNA polymerase sigma factor [Terriglobus sp. TAA 43]|uniref:RNA polymerase sigma factor n=1 Tax=Terriglobus sp. TAA 43 TaxID=278961 RepID=UPI001E34A8A3|nr:RNA polymerase sigma factor [Terriglobus sp. TAA 43]